MADKPGEVQNLLVTDVSRDHVTLTWDAPESDGGAAITSYTIEKCDVSKGSWFSAGTSDNRTLTFTARRLFEGTEYSFRVAAENKIGVGEFVALAKPVTAKLPFGKHFEIRFIEE